MASGDIPIFDHTELEGAPPPPLMDPALGPVLSWGGVLRQAAEVGLDIERVFTLVPCPLCDGDGALHISTIEDGQPLAELPARIDIPCMACEGHGQLPTRASAREERQRLQQRLREFERLQAADAEVIAEIERVAAGQLPAQAISVLAVQAPGAVPVNHRVTDPLSARRALGALHAQRDHIRHGIKMSKGSIEDIDALLQLITQARATRRWFDNMSALTRALWVAQRRAAEAVPAAPEPERRCHCGKPGAVQRPGSDEWLCKKHAYAEGLIEHMADEVRAATQVAPLCDFCEQRPAARTYEGLAYCGPCAADAELPAEDAA